jgi:tetratricopeptide (TPR) repeat protein
MSYRLKYPFLTLLLVCILGVSKSQNVYTDSLVTQFQEAGNDTTRVLLLYDLSKYYLKSNKDSALMYANRGLYIAKRADYAKGIGVMYMILGHVKVIENDLNNSIDYYTMAESAFYECDCKEELAVICLVLGNIYLSFANYPATMEYYQKGINIADDLNHNDILADFYNNMGELNTKLYNYDEASDYYNKGLQIREDAKDQLGAAYILVNLSTLNISQKKFGLAKAYLDRAHEFYNDLGHNEGLYNVYVGYASIERRQNNFLEAIEYYKQSAVFLYKIGTEYLGPTTILETDLYSNIGYCYLADQNYEMAEENLLKSYHIARETKQLEFLKTSSEYLSKLYEETEQLAKALNFARLYKTYSDSLSKDENIKKITQLEMQFEFDQMLKEKELEQTEKEARQKRKDLIYFMIFAGILLALIILFLLFRLQKVQVKRINLEKNNLQSDLNYKNRELTTNVMYLLKKNEFIINISDKLKKSRYDFKPENRKIVDSIIRELEGSTNKDTWKDFEVRFQEVHAEFYKKLIQRFPDLSPNELKLCAFLRLNMSTKEISTITFQSPKSISMARFRLRKKMNVGSYENLINYLSQF